MSFILSFYIISIVVPDPKIFLCILIKGIKVLLANGLITFFINGNPFFSNGPISLPINPP